eukprot:1966534-Rhodomonas_salina.1
MARATQTTMEASPPKTIRSPSRPSAWSRARHLSARELGRHAGREDESGQEGGRGEIESRREGGSRVGGIDG